MAFYIFLFLSIIFFIIFIAYRSARAKRHLWTPQDIGKLFAADCIKAVNKQTSPFMRFRILNDIEYVRLKYCFLILNYSSLVWWTNHLEHDISIVKFILDALTENVQSELKSEQETYELKNIIVDREELEDIISELSKDCVGVENFKIDETIRMKLSTISGFVVERRVAVYNSLLSELAAKSLKHEYIPNISPIAKAFIKHFLGDTADHDTQLIVFASTIVIPYISFFGQLCTEAIHKLNLS